MSEREMRRAARNELRKRRLADPVHIHGDTMREADTERRGRGLALDEVLLVTPDTMRSIGGGEWRYQSRGDGEQ